MWTHLFDAIMSQSGGSGEIWRLASSESRVQLSGRTVERRSANLAGAAEFRPHVIMDRGGYGAYRPVLDSCPDALKIYYGAGQRFCPPAGRHYDLVLVDTPLQARIVSQACQHSFVDLFIKPAAENLFAPVPVETVFDLVFVAHTPKPFKGHEWLIERVPSWARILRIGTPDPWFTRVKEEGLLDVEFTGLLRPEDIPAQACRARTGVVCDDGLHDSAPRVLPELLAMDIPVLMRDSVRYDRARYITPETGRLVGPHSHFGAELLSLLDAQVHPRSYYLTDLSMAESARRIVRVVEELCAQRSNT